MRNPRKKIPEDRICTYLFPDDHPKKGEQCSNPTMIRPSSDHRYCYYHQPNKARLEKQLAKAREKSKESVTKHGIYSKTTLECDKCAFKSNCPYFEEGKKSCDYTLNVMELDLDALSSIKSSAEEIMNEERKRWRRMGPIIALDPMNLEAYEVSSRCAKRMMDILKSYAQIKETYEKNRPKGWEQVADLLK